MGIIFTGISLLVIVCQPVWLLYQNQGNYQSADSSVRKFWGIQDVTVSVGKLLRNQIPSDAFKGPIVRYEVSGENAKSLPQWMLFDEKTSTLKGVPTEENIGDVRINVKAYDRRGRFVSDMFIVEVYPLLEKNTDNRRKCKKGEEIMMLALIIDKNLNDIPPITRITALENISSRLKIPINTLLLLPRELDSADTDTLSSPKEDIENSLFVNMSVITWQVGCNDRIWAEKLAIVELTKKYAKDNTLSDILQLPFVNWRLTSSLHQFRSRRHISVNDTAKIPSNNDYEDDANSDDDGDNGDDDGDNGEDDGPDDEFSPSPVQPDLSPSLSHSINPSQSERDSILPSELPYVPLGSAINSLQSSGSASSVDDEAETESPNLDELPSVNETEACCSPTPTLESSTASTVYEVTQKPSTKKKRYPPLVNKHFDALVVEAGRRYTNQIPEDIFTDEDGNTRNLTLKLHKSEICSPFTLWIEMNSKKQEIYMLPPLDAVSDYEFVIEAIDSDGMSANDTLKIRVQNPKTTLKVNFEISLHLKLAENRTPSVALQFELLDRIAKLYGDANSTNITVRNVTCNPFVFTWTNNTLSLDQCDNATISSLLEVITESQLSVNVNHKVQQEIGSLAEVERVTWRGIGLCSNVPQAILPRPPVMNFKPISRFHIDNITAKVGELLVYQIPPDAFYDADVASTRDLTLNLLTIEHTPISSDNWLQFDATNQEIYGLPMKGDVGAKYQLECNDNVNNAGDFKERQVIDIVVETKTTALYNVEFVLHLNNAYEEFFKTPLLRRTLVEKLARLFGDKSTSSIVVSKFSPGSLIVTWHNKTLPVDKCQETEIEQLRKVLLNDEMKLHPRVNAVLKPEFEATGAQVTPIGICEGDLTEQHPTEVVTVTQDIKAILFGSNVSFYIKEYFFEITLPAVIIIVTMFLACVIACVLYRRQRNAKLLISDESRRSYRNKGIPVIFQDELEERLELTNKSPIIMKEEKPPLPPPEYQKNSVPLATTALLSDFDDPSYQQGSTITFTPHRSKTTAATTTTTTPTYRKPPPYVPP